MSDGTAIDFSMAWDQIFNRIVHGDREEKNSGELYRTLISY